MLKNYFHIALRNLRRNSAYVTVNIMGLSLGIACALIIFSVIRFHLSFDNFHAGSERTYRIVTEMHRDDIGYSPAVPPPLGKFLRNDYAFSERIARIATFDEPLITIKKDEQIRKFKETDGLAFVESEYFQIFNYPLLKGNKVELLQQPNTAIITEQIARKYFGNENPVGKTFTLDNKLELQVTGVLKDLPANTDRRAGIYASYISLKTFDEWLYRDESWGGLRDALQCYIQLKPSVDPKQVEAAATAYVRKFRPNSKNVHHYKLQPSSEIHFDSRYDGPMEKRNLWILAIIGLFLIITACVNFINLATAQALKRSREVGVRKVLGGMKSQVFWQFISETVLITLLAMLVAITLAYTLLPFVNNLFQTEIPGSTFINLNLILFVVILGIVVAFLAGSYPGLVLARFQPVHALKGKISQQNVGGFNTRRTLVITQFAISQILIIGMIVIIYQMQFAKESDLGFKKDAVVMIPLGADSTGTKMNSIRNEFQKLQGVENISLCFMAPASDNSWGNFVKFNNSSEEVNFRTSIKSADDQYIPTFGLQIVAGRNLLPSDTVKEYVVNEAFARKLQFNDPEKIIGKHISANGGNLNGPIVGVVKDFHDQSFHDEITPIVITTFKNDYSNYAIRINLKQTKTTLAGIEKIWSSNHPDQIYEYQFLDENIAKFYATEEVMLKLIQTFSIIAIFISCLGLFGLVKFMAAQKTREIGIRKILGSSISQIIWIFGKEFAKLILIAFVIAAPIAWWLMNNWLQDFKYRINIGASIFLIAIAGTFLIAFLTVCYQAVRAALANPVMSLRSE